MLERWADVSLLTVSLLLVRYSSVLFEYAGKPPKSDILCFFFLNSRIWDTATGQCLRTLVHEDNAAVTSVRFSPNGKYVLAWTHDSSIRLWEYISGRCVKTYQGHVNKKYSLAGAFGTYRGEGDDKYALIASGSEDGQVILWDVSSKDVMQKLDGHEGPVLGVDTHPSEPMLVSGGLDGTVRVWASARLATGSLSSNNSTAASGAGGGERSGSAMTSSAAAPNTPIATAGAGASTARTTAAAEEETTTLTPGGPGDGAESGA